MTDVQPLPPDEYADLQKCRDEAKQFAESLVARYDIRAVTVALGKVYADVSAAAMAAGDERIEHFTLEVLVGTLREFFTPPETAPVVYYKDAGQLLGRKQ